MKNNIEDERRLLDRTVEKLQREVSAPECVAQQHHSHQILIKSSAELYLFRKKEKSHSDSAEAILFLHAKSFGDSYFVFEENCHF